MQQEDSNPNRQMLILNKKTLPPKPDAGAWIEIGTLKHIIIYPIEGGAGCTQDHAACVYFSKYGLSNTLESICDYQDRGLILFSAKNKQAKVRLYNTLRILNSGTLYKAIAKKLLEPSADLETVSIKYLDQDDNIEVKDLGDNIAQIIAELFGGTDVDLRLGVRSSESRFNYNFKARDSIPPIIGLCSEDNEEINVNFPNFRPNLVVEGAPGANYNEKDVKAVKLTDKIQEVVFPIIRPWTHTTSINENTAETPEPLLGEPYSTLMKSHLISTVYPDKCYDLHVPVFGLNMEMHSNFNEKTRLLPGAKVFVKYINLELPPPPVRNTST